MNSESRRRLPISRETIRQLTGSEAAGAAGGNRLPPTTQLTLACITPVIHTLPLNNCLKDTLIDCLIATLPQNTCGYCLV